MSYNQGLGSGYTQSTSTTPGMQTTGMHGTGTGMHGTGAGGYVQPPQNIQQTTGATPGTTGMYGQNTTAATPGMYDQQTGSTAGMYNQQTGMMGSGATTGMMGTGATPGMVGTGGTGAMSDSVVGQQYTSPTVTSYAVSKKKLSVSNGDWAITDQTGRSVFKVSGRIVTMRDTRFLYDAAGTRILTMKKKRMSMHDSWRILAGDGGQVLAKVKKTSMVEIRTSMDVMLANSTSGKHTPDYQLKGDFLDRNLTIFRGAEQAALVTRQITFSSLVLDKDTFGVTIFPGVDQALILALIVIMDEVFLHDNDD